MSPFKSASISKVWSLNETAWDTDFKRLNYSVTFKSECFKPIWHLWLFMALLKIRVKTGSHLQTNRGQMGARCRGRDSTCLPAGVATGGKQPWWRFYSRRADRPHQRGAPTPHCICTDHQGKPAALSREGPDSPWKPEGTHSIFLTWVSTATAKEKWGDMVMWRGYSCSYMWNGIMGIAAKHYWGFLVLEGYGQGDVYAQTKLPGLEPFCEEDSELHRIHQQATGLLEINLCFPILNYTTMQRPRSQYQTITWRSKNTQFSFLSSPDPTLKVIFLFFGVKSIKPGSDYLPRLTCFTLAQVKTFEKLVKYIWGPGLIFKDHAYGCVWQVTAILKNLVCKEPLRSESRTA